MEGLQPYPERGTIELKPWEELKKTATLQTTAPIFPGHPKDEDKNLRNFLGETINIHPVNEEKSIGGTVKLVKQRADTYPILATKIQKNEKLDVSVGWFNEYGPGGVFNGQKYDKTQQNLLIDHIALLFQGEKPRCPKCGIGLVNDSHVCDIDLLESAKKLCPNIELLKDTQFKDLALGKILDTEYDPKCVEKWIPELKAKHTDWNDDQVVAVAIDKCKRGETHE